MKSLLLLFVHNLFTHLITVLRGSVRLAVGGHLWYDREKHEGR